MTGWPHHRNALNASLCLTLQTASPGLWLVVDNKDTVEPDNLKVKLVNQPSSAGESGSKLGGYITMSTQEIQELFSHIDKIRRKLWCGREVGQASVMVGAGFSRNADKASETAKPFPLWWDLSELMKSEIYYTGPGISDDFKRKAPNDVLKLATQYECMFDRNALNDLIVKNIPDSSYNPGQLHKLMLSLPWADVFTTNYDTLLERAAKQTPGRKYDVVTTASDITRQMRPRIVKLHGTFPAPPFIFTEEDFRTYPSKFAPFVNLVQQSIMENVLCMIGFSGEDPNFLHWSGWVRDNLGENTPPIYLCGILDLHPSAKKVLASRNIVPLDLGILFPVARYPIAETRHRLALEWLLVSLLNGESPGLKNWPSPAGGKEWSSTSNFEFSPLPRTEPIPPIGPLAPSTSTQVQTFLDLQGTWENSRKRYPGWLVPPFSSRRTLWEHTQHWIEPVRAVVRGLEAPNDLTLMYELVWRMAKSLMPLNDELFEDIEYILKKYNPYPGIASIPDVNYTPDTRGCTGWDWRSLSEMWVELHFQGIRYSREQLDATNFGLLTTLVEPFTALRADWIADLNFERGLYSLSRFDQNAVETVLASWPEETTSALSELRRAALYAEIGQCDEAETIVMNALSSVRSQIEPFSPDFRLLSQEGWLMMLLKALKTRWFTIDSEDYKSRWEELSIHKCNPWDDINALEAAVLKVKPRNRQAISVTSDFDPGRQSTSHSLGSASEYERLYAPLNVLKLFSEIGLPLKFENVKFFSNLVIESSKLVTEHYPLWSLVSIIRTGDKKEIKNWLGRADIALLGAEQADLLADICNRQLEEGLNKLNRRRHGR